MTGINNIDLQEKCQQILENAPDGSNDLRMRYLYISLGSFLAKNVEFFYEADEQKKQEIYDNYKDVNEKMEVICRNAAYLYTDIAKALGLHCEPIEIGQDEEVKVKHWGIVYYGDNNKRYLINPIPDFYRVQLGFSTNCFCCYDKYLGYLGPDFDIMPKEQIETLDEELGYIKKGSDVKYTDDLFEKLRSEMIAKLGKHLVKTSDIYQEYYLEMLRLIADQSIPLNEKLKKVQKIDPDFEEYQELIERNINQQYIDNDMRKRIYTLSLRGIMNEIDLEKVREGAKYVGTIDRINLGKLRNEKMLYKYNYLLECMPQLTSNLTGFIENKNYMEEIKKYIFQRGERDKIHRHTVYNDENGNRKYYMLFSLALDKEKVYSFYDPETKECVRNIEPLTYMEQHHLRALNNSSLNSIINKKIDNSALLSLNEISETIVPKASKNR